MVKGLNATIEVFKMDQKNIQLSLKLFCGDFRIISIPLKDEERKNPERSQRVSIKRLAHLCDVAILGALVEESESFGSMIPH